MKVFTTGATGFLGNEALKTLHARQHSLTALVRSPQRAAGFPAEVRLVPGAIEKTDSYRDALKGHDVFLHIAALVKMWSRDRKDFDRINVDALENAIQASAKAGIPRFVYVSSFMALGPSDGSPLKEDDARRVDHTHNDYERTKYLADLLAREYQQQGHPITILYPGVIYGPGNMTDGNIVAKNLVPFLNGKMPFGLKLQPWSYAFVQNVVDGLVKVVENQPPSSRYILGGDNKSGPEFYQIVHEITGKMPPAINIPFPMATFAGYMEYLMAEWFRKEPQLMTHEVARIYRHAWALDSSRAVSELGYRITPMKEGLIELIAWLKNSGYVK